MRGLGLGDASTPNPRSPFDSVDLGLGMGALMSKEPLVPAAAAAAALELHPAAVVSFVLAVAALVLWGIHSLSFLFGRVAAERELLSPDAVGAAPTGSASGPQLSLLAVLGVAMGSALHAEPLVAAAADLGIHPGVVLAVAALFNWAILSVNWVLPPAASAAASASRPQLPQCVVLFVAMGMALHAEPLVAAAADLRLQHGVVVCVALAVTALFNWAILSLNSLMARRPAEREPKVLLRPAAPTIGSCSSDVARYAFLALAALMSASWFIEPFAAAAELRLPKTVVASFLVFFAALFNVSIHLFRSFFLTRWSPAAADAARGLGVGATAAAAAMCTGIVTAACLVAAGGSTCYVYSPVRA